AASRSNAHQPTPAAESFDRACALAESRPLWYCFPRTGRGLGTRCLGGIASGSRDSTGAATSGSPSSSALSTMPDMNSAPADAAAQPENGLPEIVTRYGVLTVPNTSTDVIGRFLARYGEWAWDEVSFLAPLLPNGAHVLDVGAFVGTFGLGLALRRELGF